MKSSLRPVTIHEGLEDHPAVRALQSLEPHAERPHMITMLKHHKHGRRGVFLLHGLGPNGSHLIAKDCPAEDAAAERAAYEQLLPRVSVSAPRYHGWHPHESGSGGWLFIEHARGVRFNTQDRGHVALASEWLGTLHAQTHRCEASMGLPVRPAEAYRGWAESARSVLEQHVSDAALAEADRDLFARIERLLERVLTSWGLVEKEYTATPRAVVHGDFVGKNMVVPTASATRGLLVFDWAEAHWGPPATDLSKTDLDRYEAEIRRHGIVRSRDSLERSQQLGVLLRWILAVRWQSVGLDPNHARTMRKLAVYDTALTSLLNRADWLVR